MENKYSEDFATIRIKKQSRDQIRYLCSEMGLKTWKVIDLLLDEYSEALIKKGKLK